MSLTENLQRNVKTLRLKKKWTQGELAEKAGISVPYISEIERGNRSPSLDTVDSLAEGFGISPQKLLANP